MRFFNMIVFFRHLFYKFVIEQLNAGYCVYLSITEVCYKFCGFLAVVAARAIKYQRSCLSSVIYGFFIISETGIFTLPFICPFAYDSLSRTSTKRAPAAHAFLYLPFFLSLRLPQPVFQISPKSVVMVRLLLAE